MKVAIISHVLPPSWSGQSVLISRLLEECPAEDYCLISEHEWNSVGAHEFSRRLPGSYHRLSTKNLFTRGQRLDSIQRINSYILGRRIARIAQEEGCNGIVAFSGSLTDFPAGFAASQILKIPFYAYACDYYSQQHSDARARAIAQKIEPRVLRGASAVIVPNEFLAEELQRRYGVEPVVIRNPCDLEAYETAIPYRTGGGEKRIVYTGAVYEAHYDAFRNLVKAIGSPGGNDVRLHLYTAQTEAELAEVGIKGPVVLHSHVSTTQVPSIQKQADVLFLPLAFDSPYPEIIKTSAPFKMGEYLAARRPILVHAPADTFLAWYFRRYDCGIVVTSRDPGELSSELVRLLSDNKLRESLTESAGRRAVDFSVVRARNLFAETVKIGACGAARSTPALAGAAR